VKSNHDEFMDSIYPFMKHNKFSRHQIQTPASAAPATAAVPLDASAIGFVPSPDEIARRAYLDYVNQGAQPGHDVQHWLAAEAQLIAERNLTRVHGFHNRT
jgi:hypothetical protein